MFPGLDIFRHMGFEPSRILDVGAYQGHFVELARFVWPHAEIHCVEANEDCKVWLRPLNVHARYACVSDCAVLRKFYGSTLDCGGAGNSLYREFTPYYCDKHLAVKEVMTTTLDAMYPSETFGLIKLDVQGAELEALKGATRMLQYADVVVAEASFVRYNLGAPLIDDLIRFMQDHGFLLADSTGPHYGGYIAAQRKTQVDLFFISDRCWHWLDFRPEGAQAPPA
jgi:FkbM family methyltransferase